ncbi:Acyl-CoA dehydrogenase family member 10 [Golovinomyces cichoracearum]|uniref:Acyl-CoA dehydrogenase family member 10 n=1 Tax=Golovinomyces cichoracearum TaxID=62708 RepID=A0A420IL13_9PEZI|nr:Acyl-CoA dehydrogenase family member 10 [Golovinomyces cichoracearum]
MITAELLRQPIDIASLEAYISKNVIEIQTPLSLKQFGFGQSNPTYQITASNKSRFVLRKKPPGILVSTTAHQVEREYRIIRALQKTDVPVPKVYCLCEDDSVIGTPFYIMEFLDGRIIEDPSMPGLSSVEKKELWSDAVHTLAKLHAVNPADVDLQSFGKPSGFYDRQIKTFNEVSKAQAVVKDIETQMPVGSIPHIHEMLQYFSDKKTQPRDRTSLIHGDYKIENLVFHKKEPRVIGIIDWEMSTIGHPLSDLTNLIIPFHLETKPQVVLVKSLPPESTKELVELYAQFAGWDPYPELMWGVAFGLFRLTAILQGVAARYAVRQASSAEAKDMAKGRHHAAKLAWEQVLRNLKNKDNFAKL